MTRDEVTNLLRSEDLKFEVTSMKLKDEDADLWTITFVMAGKKQVAHIVSAPDQDYLYLFSFVKSEQLSRPLESIDPHALRAMIRISSRVLLAKMTYIERGGWFIATSECSTSAPTGLKIRKRLEACANLALGIEKELP
jgi:hypothetical protein